MPPLAIYAVSTALFFWADRNTKNEKIKRLVESVEPVELAVWPCEVGGKLCVDFSRAEDVKDNSKKYPKCYSIRLTESQRRKLAAARSKIMSVRVFNPTRVWIDPDTKEPCALDVDDEIFYLNV